MVDRFVFVVEESGGKPLYHITIKCQELAEQFSNEEYKLIEEEFRSSILRLTMLDSQFSRHPDGKLQFPDLANITVNISGIDVRWRIMVVTKPAVEESENGK